MNTQTRIPVEAFLPYMRDVDRCERSLHELNLMWRTIESSAKINCPAEARAILPAMATTRSGFAAFELTLVESLVQEKLGSVQAELLTRAQYIIDVVVRNLYERTADVSFLATDRELCSFVAGSAEEQAGAREAVRRRLRAYRDKYTVYEEIILLDTQGKVLAQIDESQPVERSRDPLVGATLAADHYVETFRATDLRPLRREALVYSRRICDPDSGIVTGVLCLCFAFEDELQGIFASQGALAGRANMLLLDAGNRVIASADPLWIPPGTRVPVNPGGRPEPLLFGGRKYLVHTFAAAGYQGYPGPPGWQGQVMVPLDIAFGDVDGALQAPIDPAWARGLLKHAHVFCPPLFELLAATTMIRRVVWNVQAMTAGSGGVMAGDMARLDSIMEQIGETGRLSNDMFSRAIKDLFATALSRGMRETGFMSRLLVDLHDRNLYERANDCRWWASSPELQALLAGPPPGRQEGIGRILGHLNSLYTVYHAIFVYGPDGSILASSGEEAVDRIDEATLAQVLALRGEQDYHVSSFLPSSHYEGKPTYVFHAAIRDPGNRNRVLGGIGLVFDAHAEFGAMLDSVLNGRNGLTAFFVDRSGAILASTDPARPIGSMLDIDHTLLSKENGTSAAGMLVHDRRYAIVGSTVSSGYREFKNTDGYRADVIAVVVESFGELDEGPATADTGLALAGADRSAISSAAYASFFVGGQLFAIPAGSVCQALPVSSMSSVSMGAWGGRVGVLAPGDGSGIPGYVWVFDLGALLGGAAAGGEGGEEVIVVRRGQHAIGLLVGELHGVTRFDRGDIQPVLFGNAGSGALVGQLIKANGGDCLVQVIDIDCLFDLLDQPQPVHALPSAAVAASAREMSHS